MDPSAVNKIVGAVEKERLSRERGIAAIVKLVRGPGVPQNLRVLTVMTLSIFVLFSFQLSVFICHIGCAVWLKVGIQPMWYMGTFGAEFFTSLLISIPLLPRLTSFGEARRLEENLNVVADSNASKHARPSR